MAVQSETTFTNPFTDPENRLRRPASESGIEMMLREGQALAKDSPHVVGADHKTCSCSSFCRFLSRATHDSDIATDLQNMENFVHRDGYKQGHKSGYQKGYEHARKDAEELDSDTIQAAIEQGFDEAMEFVFAERMRQRAAWKEEMKVLEKRDVDAEDREWAEYLTGLNEPAKVTVWARRAKDALKDRVKKGKGKEIVVDEDVEKETLGNGQKGMSKTEAVKDKIMTEREEKRKAKGEDPRCRKCGCRMPEFGGRCRC